MTSSHFFPLFELEIVFVLKCCVLLFLLTYSNWFQELTAQSRLVNCFSTNMTNEECVLYFPPFKVLGHKFKSSKL